MAFFSGFFLGLAMILPLGPQNLYILSTSLTKGVRKGLVTAVTAGLCDTTLILIGALGLSAVFDSFPFLQKALLWVGVVFLLYLGIAPFLQEQRSGERTEPELGDKNQSKSSKGIVIKTVAVSWGNPHAILDTVAVLGSTIAAQPLLERKWFASGVVSASWTFFIFLVVLGSIIERRLKPGYEVWIRRITGIIMLIFAGLLAQKALIG